jgi:hypothetical protein
LIFRLLQNITKAATQLYAPSGSVEAFAVSYCWTRLKKTAQRTTNLKGTGWKQNTRHKLRLFKSDDEDALAPAENEAAPVEES